MLSSRPAVAVFIPARYGSARFPGKPLAELAGKPLIQHVYEAAKAIPHVHEIQVVTDDFSYSPNRRRVWGAGLSG